MQKAKNSVLPAGKKNQKDLTSHKTTSQTKSNKTQEPQTMDELFSQTGYTLKGFKRGDIVEGKVILVGRKQLRLDIGGKGEAQVHEKEMDQISDFVATLKVGDTIKVQVVNLEDDRGQTIVSLRKTALSKRWDMLKEKMKSEEQVDVLVRELSRGGFLVDYLGLRGFVPLSQTEAEFAKLGERASGRRVKVKIIEVDQAANRLVFSQVSAGASGAKQQKALNKVKIGDVYKADVTGIAPFGAFVTVKIDAESSLPGLIHISEIAWEKVESPSDYVQTGKTIDVKAIGIDKKTGKLTLSLKQLTTDPWEDVAKIFKVDETVKGKVSRLSQYGAFITLLPGIEGLVHISKMAPGEEPKAGADVECLIEQIDPEKRKISLSLVTHAKPIGYR